MDDDKLAFAKYAYDYCIDKANYYQIGDVFRLVQLPMILMSL